MTKPPNFNKLKEATISDSTTINQIFLDFLNDLKVYLDLELINKRIKIIVLKRSLNNEISDVLLNNGVIRSLNDDTYHIKLYEKYKKFFPFFLLQSAYLTFVPNRLKNTNLIDYAINKFVEFDLQEFKTIEDWNSLNKGKYKNYIFRFDKYFESIEDKSLGNPQRFFFEYINRYRELNIDERLYFFLSKMYEEFIFKTSKKFRNDKIIETVRVSAKILYIVKNCDSLTGYFNHFQNLKKQGVIKTNLSLRSFKRNLRWINKYSSVTPTYYFDWQALDIAVIPSYFKFNSLLKKSQIDKVINKMPFLIMPKLSINNFSTELSAYFVIPRIYIKDLISLIKKLEDRGFITKKFCGLAKNYTFSINLNYFREFYRNGQIINPKNNNYSKMYEIDFIQDYNGFSNPKLDLLDFLILERIRFFSYVGISFSRSKEISKVIKSDLNDFLSQENYIIKELEEILEILKNNIKLQESLSNFLENNKKFGFFFSLNRLEQWIKFINLLTEKPRNSFKNLDQIKNFLKSENIAKIINEEGVYDKINPNGFNFNHLFIKYLNSEERFNIKVQEIKFYYRYLKLFSNLKILDITKIQKIMKNKDLIKKIIKIKKNQLEKFKKEIDIRNISNEKINSKLNKFLNKNIKIIKPYLVNSIWTNSISTYFPQIILKNTPVVKSNIKDLKTFFPKVYFYVTEDLFNEREIIFLQLFSPFLDNSEKENLLSIILKLFKDALLSFKRYSWDGFIKAFSRKNFYDYKKQEFFYSNELFKEYFTFVKKIFGNRFYPLKGKSEVFKILHSKYNNNINSLLYKVRNRLNLENINFNEKDLEDLLNFHQNFECSFLNKTVLYKSNSQKFYKNYVKSIQINPAFQYFGLEQYCLYITPFDVNDIDLQLLFMNTFQKIHHLASIDITNSFLIQYIFPYGDPNTSYLNWLRSKNKIQEYCLFAIKSFNQIFHFNHSLTSNGWSLDSNSFKIYTQNILSNHNYEVNETHKKSFKVGNLSISNYHGPNSSYFEELMDLYNRETIDIKRNLNLSNYSVLEKIQNLMNRKLIFPYITFRNLDLKEKIHIMVFNLKGDSIEIIKKVFQYFNLVYLFEIEGEYYIHGLDEPQKIHNGLMIKLYLPDCELAEILRILEYVFQYLEVERYLIIPDLVDGESFLKTVYGDISFLEDYNPLNNLIWNERTKTWKNHTLFTQNFEYLYPDLIYQQNKT